MDRSTPRRSDAFQEADRDRDEDEARPDERLRKMLGHEPTGEECDA